MPSSIGRGHVSIEDEVARRSERCMRKMRIRLSCLGHEDHGHGQETRSHARITTTLHQPQR